MGKRMMPGIIAIGAMILLAIIFTLDDVTVIGEFADPLEFIVMGAAGYYLAGR